MEVEHVPYIFGSFTRRRQSQHMSSSKTNPPQTSAPTPSQSLSNPSSIRLRPTYQHAKSKSQPEETYQQNHQTAVASSPNSRNLKTRSCLVQLPPAVPRRSGIIPGVIGLNGANNQKSVVPNNTSSVSVTSSPNSVHDCFPGVNGVSNSVKSEKSDNNDNVVRTSFGNGELAASCPLCGKIFLEPRVLSCLHTFCTRCLQEVVDARRNEEEMWLPVGVYTCTSDSEDSSISGKTSSTNNDKDSLDGSTVEHNTLPRIKPTNRNSNSSLTKIQINHNRSHSSPVSNSKNSFTNSKITNSNRDSNVSNISDTGGCIICPVCNTRTALSRHGILGLPPDYVVQHRLVLSTLNDENTRLLCDLCTGEVTASHRCSDCLINLCPMCTELHHRHNNHNHELLTIRDVRQRGLMRIHRQIMCLVHPEFELTSYCCQCMQVVCTECVRLYHNGHTCEISSRAAVSRIGRVKRSLQRARASALKERKYIEQLKLAKTKTEETCNKVEKQIENWIEEYQKAIEEHRKKLLQQIAQIREDNLSSIISHHKQLETRLQETETSINFTETLLDEGSDIELLTFMSTILKKFDKFDKTSNSILSSMNSNKNLMNILNDDFVKNGEQDCDENNHIHETNHFDNFIQFLPKENVIYQDFNIPIYGIITDQKVSAKMSEIRTDGLESTRINQAFKFTIICRDNKGNQLKYGGEQIFIQIGYTYNSLPTIKETVKSISKELETNENISKTNELTKKKTIKEFRQIPFQIEDKHNGTYIVSFIPDDVGTLLIDVKLNGQHIQDSPLTLHLHNTSGVNNTCTILRPHRGIYHCCSWCSSGGKKITDLSIDNKKSDFSFNGNCACGGKMPGGYQGCGHGHPGHPGKKHWSCCGSIQEFGSSCTSRKHIIENKNCKTPARVKNNEGALKNNGVTTKVYHITL